MKWSISNQKLSRVNTFQTYLHHCIIHISECYFHHCIIHISQSCFHTASFTFRELFSHCMICIQIAVIQWQHLHSVRQTDDIQTNLGHKENSKRQMYTQLIVCSAVASTKKFPAEQRSHLPFRCSMCGHSKDWALRIIRFQSLTPFQILSDSNFLRS